MNRFRHTLLLFAVCILALVSLAACSGQGGSSVTLHVRATFKTDGDIVGISPDGKSLLLLNADSSHTELFLVDVASGTLGADFGTLPDIVRDVSWTSDGKNLLIYTTSAVLGYDVASGDPGLFISSLDTSGPFQGFAVHPSREKFLLATFDELIEYDARTGKELGRAESGYDSFLQELTYSPDGTKIAALYSGIAPTANEKIILTDAQTKKMYAQIEDEFKTYVGGAFGWLPDSSGIVTAVVGEPLTVWDAKTGAKAQTIGGTVPELYNLQLTPDGKRIVAIQVQNAGQDYSLNVWNTDTKQSLGKTVTSIRPTVLLSPDGKFAAISEYLDATSNGIRLFNLSSGAEIGRLDADGQITRGLLQQTAKPSVTASAVWSPDSSTLYISYGSGEILVWQINSP